ncbi:MAG: hypothetical protein LBS42_05095 [Tannerella sp.]|jgi:hypothetical protein|nr:hypothetical protein [Tannerella sp.]
MNYISAQHTSQRSTTSSTSQKTSAIIGRTVSALRKIPYDMPIVSRRLSIEANEAVRNPENSLCKITKAGNRQESGLCKFTKAGNRPESGLCKITKAGNRSKSSFMEIITRF